MKKQFSLALAGFAGVMVALSADGKTISVTVDGKAVKAKKNQYTLTATENIEASGIEAGGKYPFTPEQLKEMGDSGNLWEDVNSEAGDGEFSLSDGEVGGVKELTEDEKKAQAEKEARIAAKKELTKKVKDIQAQILDKALKGEDVTGLRADYEAAQKELEALAPETKAKTFTEAEQKIIGEFEADRAEYVAMLDVVKSMKSNLEGWKEKLPEGYKIGKIGSASSGGSGESVAARGNRMSYEDAQKMRARYAELIGEEKEESEAIKIVADEFNCTPQNVSFKVNYQQYPLRKGDTAFTPLVNKHFPEQWMREDGKLQVGAPLEGEYKLSYNERYVQRKAVETAE